MEETIGISNEEHQLWVNLSVLTEGNLTRVLPRLIQEMLGSDALGKDDLTEIFEITLPSDLLWRDKTYQKLLAKQRKCMAMEEQLQEESIVLHDWNIIPAKNEKVFCAPDAQRLAKKDSAALSPVTWTVSDIAKAASLLLTPPQKTHFQDEQEMRRVYTLIYDVFRYKTILNQALTDTAFFLLYPKLVKEQTRVWLLLYDMYHRSFKKREVKVLGIATKMFAECGLLKVEDALWEQRVKVAAAVARLRIEKSALRLNELLPVHLRDEKNAKFDATPVTCWVNIRKMKNKNELQTELGSKLGLVEINSDLTPGPGHFKWDPHCPHFLELHPSVRTKLAQSSLVKKHKLIVQSKAFCVGPATFGKIISDLQLAGTVVQTHVNSPRTVAYLATVLSQNENIKKLMAFSAGNRKREYENYFHELGMKNIVIYSEKLIDVAPDANYLEEVIAVFATPPNSYSAVTDPIDLVCSRGGDLAMLEILTESEETKQTRERVANILDEQKKTLRFAMSRPQIQFVLYETHSEIDAENSSMVERAIKEINRTALLHHATLQGKLQIQESNAEINNNENPLLKTDSSGDIEMKDVHFSESGLSVESKISEGSDTEERLQSVVVPDCDVFSTPEVPDICTNLTEKCTTLSSEGCYLALLQRKQVTNMDNKYMIQMAEARGLFGRTSPPARKSTKSVKGKKPERVISPTNKPKKKTKHLEVDRIAAPTLASIQHSKAAIWEASSQCPKHSKEGHCPNQPKQWWSETTRHLNSLRTSLVKQKVLPANELRKNQQPTSKNIVNTFVHSTQRIDEIVAKSTKSSTSSIPLYPKLRLTRKPNKKEKVPCPITVTFVKFNGSNHRCLRMNC